jgi:hypothetical protein
MPPTPDENDGVLSQVAVLQVICGVLVFLAGLAVAGIGVIFIGFFDALLRNNSSGTTGLVILAPFIAVVTLLSLLRLVSGLNLKKRKARARRVLIGLSFFDILQCPPLLYLGHWIAVLSILQLLLALYTLAILFNRYVSDQFKAASGRPL